MHRSAISNETRRRGCAQELLEVPCPLLVRASEALRSEAGPKESRPRKSQAESADGGSRVEDVECIVHATWKIASRERPSTTREYIGVLDLNDLRPGRGEFTTEGEFCKYWRAHKFKLSAAMEKILNRASQQT